MSCCGWLLRVDDYLVGRYNNMYEGRASNPVAGSEPPAGYYDAYCCLRFSQIFYKEAEIEVVFVRISAILNFVKVLPLVSVRGYKSVLRLIGVVLNNNLDTPYTRVSC